MGSDAELGEFSVPCLIETESEYEAGKPILVTGTLRNSGASPIWVLSWHTFLDADWRHCLSVNHNGWPISYTGMSAVRSAPTKEAYFRLGPGESRSRQIDISHRYDLTEAGTYTVGFRMVLLVAWEVTADHWPSDNTAYQPIVVESDLVSFDLTGAFPELPIVSLDAPRRIDAAEARDETSRVKKAKDPTFVNMTADQSGAFLLAHRWAYKAINEALASAKVGSTWEYKRWMEDMFLGRAGREDRHRTVIANLSAMAEWMETASINYEFVADCQVKDWDAWTWVKQRSTISVCGRAMNDHWLRFWYLHSPDWGRALLLIHEIAHAVAGVGDHVPAWPTLCNHLALAYPWLAVDNAHNYALLAMGATSGPPEDSPADNGIWTSHPVPGDWYISHAPAAALIAEDAVMTAYAEAPAHGGRLSYRMLHLEDGKENGKTPH